MRICDPALGSASMLTNVASYVEREGGDPLRLALYGQELNPDVLAMGKLGVLLHGLSAAGLEAGDIFTEPALLDAENRLLRYDRVIAHPPFGLRDWGREFALSDPHHRFDRYGPVPPRSPWRNRLPPAYAGNHETGRHGGRGGAPRGSVPRRGRGQNSTRDGERRCA